jgi:hypothetical protein
MQPMAVVSAFVALIGIMITIFIQLNASVDQKIETKLKDPDFIRKVAAEVRLPFVIFDEDKSVIVDTGAMDHITSIEVHKGERQEVSEIIISPKKFMAIAPILENLDGRMEFESPIRGANLDFVFKKVQMGSVWADTYASGHPPKRKFRLQLVLLPKE